MTCNHKDFDPTCDVCKVYRTTQEADDASYAEAYKPTVENRLAELEKDIAHIKKTQSVDFQFLYDRIKEVESNKEEAAQKDKDIPVYKRLDLPEIFKNQPEIYVRDPNENIALCGCTWKVENGIEKIHWCKTHEPSTPHIDPYTWEKAYECGRKEERERLKKKFDSLVSGLNSKAVQCVGKELFDEVNNG
jgi:hypothetical protein